MLMASQYIVFLGLCGVAESMSVSEIGSSVLEKLFLYE